MMLYLSQLPNYGQVGLVLLTSMVTASLRPRFPHMHTISMTFCEHSPSRSNVRLLASGRAMFDTPCLATVVTY